MARRSACPKEACCIRLAASTPLAGAYYTLSSVAAVGHRRREPQWRARRHDSARSSRRCLLTLLPMDLIFLGIDPNYGQVIQGTLIVLVVMVGGFAAFLQGRK